MRRLYTKWKKIWPWRWRQCERCHRFFRHETGWRGWYVLRGAKIEKYVCGICCVWTTEVDEFFANRCEWFPGVTTSQMPRHISLLQSTPREVRKDRSHKGGPGPRIYTLETALDIIRPPQGGTGSRDIVRPQPTPSKNEHSSRYDILKEDNGQQI